MIGVGQFLCGGGMAFLTVLSLPEMQLQANKAYKNREEQVSSYCSGIFNSCLGIGQVIGPLYGANVSVAIGFRYCQDIVALLTFAWAVFYFSLAEGVIAF